MTDTPELWVSVGAERIPFPEVVMPVEREYGRITSARLRRVPFDEAVERMLDAWNTKLQTPMGAKKRAEKRVLCERLLLAAVGGEGL